MELLSRIKEFGADRLAKRIYDSTYSPGSIYASDFFGDIELVQQRGGEGEGDDFFIVAEFKSEGKLIKFQGWYSSYDGVEWSNDVKEVRPVEKIITVYE